MLKISFSWGVLRCTPLFVRKNCVFTSYSFPLIFCTIKPMKEYIKRLEACGYSIIEACELCADLARNLPFYEIEFFIKDMEAHYVG